MTNDVEICNQALTMLGAKTISSLEENSPEARRCNSVFSTERDLLLQKHRWNFASDRRLLAKLSTAPDFGYTAQFQLPNDFLQVTSIYNAPNAEFRIEGSKLLCNLDKVQLVYVKRVTDSSKFDPHFAQALSLAIAAKIAYAFTSDVSLANLLDSQLNKMMAKARRLDSQNSSLQSLKYVRIDNE